MEWSREETGKMIQDARLRLGLTLEDAGARARLKPAVLSSLEKGRHSRTPNRATQLKIEAALDIVLPIPRDKWIKTTLYIPIASEPDLLNAMTRFPGKSRSGALMCALKEWSEHRRKLDEWNKTHGDNL